MCIGESSRRCEPGMRRSRHELPQKSAKGAKQQTRNHVAQTGSLLYRGLVIRGRYLLPNGLPTASRRYSRLTIRATPKAHPPLSSQDTSILGYCSGGETHAPGHGGV